MTKAKSIFAACLCLTVLSGVFAYLAVAGENYKITFEDLEQRKHFFDDPRPYLKDFGYDKILPPDVYRKLTYDVESMKQHWANLVGFKAPDLVGKIAPEIQPGVYTSADKEKYPGFKELMYPELYDRFAPGGPSHAGNYPEIKVVPTRQYYWSLPLAEASKAHEGETQLDGAGYIVNASYKAGFPFPKPSGPHKPQQILYNWVKRYYGGENAYFLQQPRGFTKDLRMDFDGLAEMYILRLQGRVGIAPLGWFDTRAEAKGESRAVSLINLAPRDSYGNNLTILEYLDPDQLDQFLLYINVMRRVRKMSASDTQDAVGGQDLIYDDNEGFSQKLTPKHYPYKVELLAEREYLTPAPVWDGSGYMSSKDLGFYGCEFERRPMYVLKLTQLDDNYVYSYRILYIDKETFLLMHIENYDQKKRLYRTADNLPCFVPEMGLFFSTGFIGRDYIDLHTTYARHFTIPATWIGRNDVDMSMLSKGAK